MPYLAALGFQTYAGTYAAEIDRHDRAAGRASESCEMVCQRGRSRIYCTSIQQASAPMGLFQDASTDRPCRECEHWGGDVADGLHAKCLRGREQIQANPERGCVYWIRAIGGDDDAPRIAD